MMNYLQILIALGIVGLVVSVVMAVRLVRDKNTRRLALGWTCAAAVLLLVIVVYFLPTKLQWSVPAEETVIRVLGESTSVQLSDPAQKEKLISALTDLRFQRPLFNGKSGNYDPEREAHFVICLLGKDNSRKITVAISADDGSVRFIETDTGWKALSPHCLLEAYSDLQETS